MELSSTNPDADVVITWNEANSGLNSDVLYKWNAFEEGSAKSDLLLSLQSDNGGKDNQLTISQGELDEALTDLGLAVGETITLNWFISATNGDITKETNVSTVTIKRFVNEIASFDLESP
ncbi:SusE domain-containing protein, partial [Fulvivirga aurantia]|uniref:SusE domain-containing protein n=1 Tax=Fulvivirga aurantia TaxID=2529383 RepID=UPI0031B628D5